MKARRAARRLALDVLYQAEIRDELPAATLDARRAAGWIVDPDDDSAVGDADVELGPEVTDYASFLVTGVQEHHADIDSLITSYADRWAIERMPVIDRNLVRIALFELLWGTEVPVAVAINEAVELAKSLSTEDSGKFVNGLLGKIVEMERSKPRA